MNFRQTFDHVQIELQTTLDRVVKTTGDHTFGAIHRIHSSYDRMLLGRGVKLLKTEIQEAYQQNISMQWKRDGLNGSKISQAKSPSLWLDRPPYSEYFKGGIERYPNTESVFLDKKKQQSLRTTTAVWPLSKASQAECLRK